MSGGSKSKEQRAMSKEWASYFDAERDRSNPPESTKEAAWQGLDQLLAPSAETATGAADSSIGKDADAADVSERDGENDLTAALPTTQETTSSVAEGLGKTEGALANAAQIALPLGVAKLAIAFAFGGAVGAATTATLMQAAHPEHTPAPPHDMRDEAPAASTVASVKRPSATSPPGSSTDEPAPTTADATPKPSADAAGKRYAQPPTSAALRPRPTGGASSSKNSKPHAADLALARERALIERARSALARGAAAQALAAANAHRQSFPDGRLAEEREVIVIRALAAQGRRDAAAKRAAGFRKTYPKSLLSPAVDGASPPEGH